MTAFPTTFYYPFPRSWQLTVPCTDPVHLQLLAQATTAPPAFATFPVLLTYPIFALNGPVCSFHRYLQLHLPLNNRKVKKILASQLSVIPQATLL